jgi:hypothetical protein
LFISNTNVSELSIEVCNLSEMEFLYEYKNYKIPFEISKKLKVLDISNNNLTLDKSLIPFDRLWY